jgi:hypothetical protein
MFIFGEEVLHSWALAGRILDLDLRVKGGQNIGYLGKTEFARKTVLGRV